MKSIIFNEAMAKAWHEGRKTVTRRPDGLKYVNLRPDLWKYAGIYDGDDDKFRKYRGWHKFSGENQTRYARPRYLPGETVYIRETWMQFPGYGNIFYRATDQDEYDQTSMQEGYHPWKPSIHTPEWAARSHARIVSVRAERVQEITEEGAILEGFAMTEIGITARTCFRITWNHIYPGSWAKNDWVWVIELEKLP